MHEKTIKKRLLFKGRVVNFRKDTVRLISGRIAWREFMDHPGAVGVLPILPNGKVVLIKQYRYPVHVVTYEIPAGKLTKGEKPLSCIKRELAEEAGLKARNIKKLTGFWPTPAFSNEIIHLYVVTDLTPCAGTPDYDEFLERVEVPLKTALRWVHQGKIKDAKTIIALLLYQAQSY